jgi:GTP-binding protein
MLVDKINLIFKGGNGGHGKMSFRRNQKGPDGGNGGRGGDLYVRAVNNIYLLNKYEDKMLFQAERGQPGADNQRSGHAGADLDVPLPVGSVVTNRKTGRLICELNKVGERFLICKGGVGGIGNWELRSEENTTPMETVPAGKGTTQDVVINLKLIAHYGLIGLPNAGKSSLLNELTNANAKTANYQFTTLEPNLGDLFGKIIADIPGLIEGASEGKGLGIEFLKHIEKVKTLIHCVSAENENMQSAYNTVRAELTKFNEELIKKPEIILLTKTDTVNPEELSQKSKALKKFSDDVLEVSIHDYESIQKLKKELTD